MIHNTDCTFAEIKEGGTFVCDNTLFIKMRKQEGVDVGDADGYATSLRTAEFRTFYDYTVVVPIRVSIEF